MNDQQIYELLAKKPRMRASELANVFCLELTVVSSALRSLVDVGDLVKSKEFDDNGRQSQVYELSDEFRKSREGKALLAGIDWTTPTPPTPAAPAPVDAAPVAPIIVTESPTPPQDTAPRRSKVQIALDFIASTGPATDAQLRAAMGLAGNVAPGAYLVSARNAGKVVKVGDGWQLGGGAAPEKKMNDSVEKIGNIIVATRDSTPVPSSVVTAITGAPAPAAKTTASQLRCALWSDGTIQLQRDGADVARLTEDEFAFMRAYMAKREAAC